MKSLMSWLPFKREDKQVPVKRTTSPGSDHPMGQMRREVDRLFERLMADPFGSGLWSMNFNDWYGDFSPARFAPSIDIADEAKHIRVTAELPGMEEKDVQVTLRDDALVIHGEKKLEETSERDGYYRTERSFGAFERTIPLPVTVDPDRVEATFTKGVLTVRLPKVADAPASKQIPVRSA